VHLIRHGLKHVLQELPSCLPVCLVDELGHRKLACAVNADEQKQLPLSGLQLGDVDMKEADGVAFELLSLRPVTLHVRQPRNAVSLQAPVQCRARQMRDAWLQGIEAVIQRQQRVPPESDDGRLLSLGQDRRTRFSWPGLEILNRLALSPLRNRLRVNPDPGSTSRAKLAIVVLQL
jgi:hypothetical protein